MKLLNAFGVYKKIRGIIESARMGAARSVNTAQVVSNWLIGRVIVEGEQKGRTKAKYGDRLLEIISRRLTSEYGAGYSVDNLEAFRWFYKEYPGLIAYAVSSKRGKRPISETLSRKLASAAFPCSSDHWNPGVLHTNLSWSMYKRLVRVGESGIRAFYEIEAIRNNWSVRELERQINSQLYERLALSRDKKGVMELAKRGHTVQQPVDVIKDPYMLEFLDLPESDKLLESGLEQALIGKLQSFLLELGQGFAFVGRQRRLTLDGDHFYPDLVFYHIKLRCYVVIELKTAKLTHADLGQMLMYVNYYDREVSGAGDNPTIGLMLCTDKNEAVVKYVLGENNRRIFASRYKTCLPSEASLRAKLRRELERLPAG